MNKFYVTYGCNSDQANNYSVVEAEDIGAARQQAFDVCGQKWAFIYDEEAFIGAKQPERYGLTEVPLAPQTYTDFFKGSM